MGVCWRIRKIIDYSISMKKLLYIFLSAILFSSCDDKDLKVDDESNQYREDSGIYVTFATRSDGWTIDDEYVQFKDNVGTNEEKPYIIDHFNDGDILFISQMGVVTNPTLYNMKTNENAAPDYNKNTVKDNLYVYQYQTPEESAEWTRGSNFVPYVNDKNMTTPMNWTYIRNLGSIGNAFSFYALFQGNNQTPNCRTVTYMNYSGNDAEYAPHSAYELGTRYGLFGAYHATSSLYTRMRFRLYPLFNLIQVTLLVPAQESESDKPGYSGFAANAFKNNWYAGNTSAQIYPGVWFGVPGWAVNSNIATSQVGIGTSFDIDWRKNGSSDNDPPSISAQTGNTNTSFYLLRYDINDPSAEHPVFRLDNIKKFYPKYENENHPDEDYDMVRRYEFIAYYVPQAKFNENSFNALLSIRMLTPGSSGNLYYIENNNYKVPMSVEGSYVPYFFYGNSKKQDQIVGGDSDLGLTKQGNYTHLTLYVPRRGNETVMVSAKVIPWKETYTDMTIVEREEETE